MIDTQRGRLGSLPHVRFGRTVHPDFTISAADGRTIYWEHAGMLDLPDYARKWELKKAWYADNHVLPFPDGGGSKGTLIWTDDLHGADAKAWLEFAAGVLGVTPSVSSADGAGAAAPPARRVAKKTAAKLPDSE